MADRIEKGDLLLQQHFEAIAEEMTDERDEEFARRARIAETVSRLVRDLPPPPQVTSMQYTNYNDPHYWISHQ